MKKRKTKQQANCYLMYYYYHKKQSTYKTPLRDTVFIHIDVKWVVDFNQRQLNQK